MFGPGLGVSTPSRSPQRSCTPQEHDQGRNVSAMVLRITLKQAVIRGLTYWVRQANAQYESPTITSVNLFQIKRHQEVGKRKRLNQVGES